MAMVTEKMIDEWVAEHKQEMIDELLAWVSHPSVSRADLAAPNAPYGEDCRKMLDFALAEGKRFGFRTEDYEGYCGAVISGDKKREIGLVAHLDVVPEGEGWLYSPYEPVVVNDFMVGRGCSDNKGPGVLGLYLLKFFRDNDVPFNSALRLMMGCAEETGMADFKHYIDVLHGPVPEVSLVTDCSFPVCYAQKGGFDAAFMIPAGANIVEFKAGLVRNSVPDLATVTISGITAEEARAALEGVPKVEIAKAGEYIQLLAHGKAGHAAFPDHGEKKNAIVLAADALVVLQEKTGLDLRGGKFISERFVTPFGDGLDIQFEDEMSGELTINAGVIKKVGDMLHLDIDIRYPVTDDDQDIQAKLEKAAKEADGELVEVGISHPFYIDPESPMVSALMSAYKDITGDDSKPYSMGGGTYSRVIPNGISFGPGLAVGSHKPEFMPEGHGSAHGLDETLSIEDWLTAFKIYALALVKLDAALDEMQ